MGIHANKFMGTPTEPIIPQAKQRAPRVESPELTKPTDAEAKKQGFDSAEDWYKHSHASALTPMAQRINFQALPDRDKEVPKARVRSRARSRALARAQALWDRSIEYIGAHLTNAER